MSTTFVTGANGFIGAHLTRALLDAGHAVKVLSRRSAVDNPLWSQAEVTLVQGDLLDPAGWQAALADCAFVFHTAGEVRDESKMQALNVTATKNLFDACAAHNIQHIVHLSSVGVIGASRAGEVDEAEACTPFNAYEVSKWDAEQMIAAWQTANSIPVALLRPTVVYGELARSPLILLWLKLAKRGIALTIGANAMANYVHVADVASACLAANKAQLNDTVIVANPVSLREFIHSGAAHLGIKQRNVTVPVWLAMGLAKIVTPLFGLLRRNSPWSPERVKALAMETEYVSTKITTLTGWQAQPHAEGLAKTIDWYQSEGVL